MTTKYYYTLGDILERLLKPSKKVIAEMRLGKQFPTNNGYTFEQVIKKAFTDLDANWTDEVLSTDEVNNLWNNYVVPKLWSNYVAINDADLDDNSISTSDKNAILLDMSQELLATIAAIIKATYSRYKAILDAYKAEEGHLMDGLTSKSTSKFNDTPQGSGDYTNDQYTSTITQSSNETDVGTPMQRLEEITKGYKDTYGNWTNDIMNAVVFWSV